MLCENKREFVSAFLSEHEGGFPRIEHLRAAAEGTGAPSVSDMG